MYFSKIKLTQGFYAKVDKRDFAEINKFKWQIQHGKNGVKYAHRKIYLGKENGKIKSKTARMHNQIMGKKKGFILDHEDRDGLNNRRKNLRFITYGMNNLNSTSRKGYYYSKERKRFICRVRLDGKTNNLGRFQDENDAIRAIKRFKDHIFYREEK